MKQTLTSSSKGGISTATQTDPSSLSESSTAIPVGISSCLLGEPVRFNGGHTRSKLCVQDFAQYFQFQGFCPEVAAGLSVPRPALRLIGTSDQPRMVHSDDNSQDITDEFLATCEKHMPQFEQLDGYILMKNSPSCGLARIKVYRDNGYPQDQRTAGLFVQQLQKHYPHLPIEEEGRLNDSHLRENFVLKVYAHHHFRRQVTEQLSLGALMAFHRDYKYVLMAHNQVEYRALGRMLAQTAKDADLNALREVYLGRFMQAIDKPASRGNHCNTLLHILGYLKKAVDGQVRQDIAAVIDQYRLEEVNLAVPLTLIQHYIKRHGSDYIRAQRYLEPYPAALGLSNSI